MGEFWLEFASIACRQRDALCSLQLVPILIQQGGWNVSRMWGELVHRSAPGECRFNAPGGCGL